MSKSMSNYWLGHLWNANICWRFKIDEGANNIAVCSEKDHSHLFELWYLGLHIPCSRNSFVSPSPDCITTRLKLCIAPLSDTRMFSIRYLTIHKVHMHAGAIRKLLYDSAHVREIIHLLKLVDYLPVHTHKPYNNLHLKPLLFQRAWQNSISTKLFQRSSDVKQWLRLQRCPIITVSTT